VLHGEPFVYLSPFNGMGIIVK